VKVGLSVAGIFVGETLVGGTFVAVAVGEGVDVFVGVDVGVDVSVEVGVKGVVAVALGDAVIVSVGATIDGATVGVVAPLQAASIIETSSRLIQLKLNRRFMAKSLLL
jgi:hypothetical protein